MFLSVEEDRAFFKASNPTVTSISDPSRLGANAETAPSSLTANSASIGSFRDCARSVSRKSRTDVSLSVNTVFDWIEERACVGREKSQKNNSHGQNAGDMASIFIPFRKDTVLFGSNHRAIASRASVCSLSFQEKESVSGSVEMETLSALAISGNTKALVIHTRKRVRNAVIGNIENIESFSTEKSGLSKTSRSFKMQRGKLELSETADLNFLDSCRIGFWKSNR